MHQPKQIILTKREGDEIRTALFAEASTREQEREAFDLAHGEGWMCHVSQPGNATALDDAVQMHHEIERHHHLRTHSGCVCPD